MESQPIVLRLLVLRDMVSRRLVFTSVDEAASSAGSAPAAPDTPGTTTSPAKSGIVSSALFMGGAAMRHARMLTGLITAAGRKPQVRATPAAHSEPGSAPAAIPQSSKDGTPCSRM